MPSFKDTFNVSEQGQWFDIPEVSGFKVLVARANNAQFQNKLRRLAEPYPELGQLIKKKYKRADVEDVRDDQNNELLQRILKEAFCGTVLLGWEGMVDDDEAKTVIPYSEEKAFELFKEYDSFFQMIAQIAQDTDAFRARRIEEQEGNS